MEIASYALNELGNAQRLEAQFVGQFVWTKATDWMVYRNGLWQRDTSKQVVRSMIFIVESLAMSEDEEERKWSFKSGTNKAINGSLNVASGLKGFARNYASFNRKTELFNCANGTYNLATGAFQQHDPKDMMTKGSPVKYDPEATCPRFEQFLFEVMAEKDSLRQFLQRACGSTLSSETPDPALFIPHGGGGTGKTQFLTVMRGILGSYAEVADSEMFMAKRGDVGQPFEMAGMEGVRALFSSEVEDGKRLAQAKVKQFTGGDPVKACYKGKEAYTFVPQWKIWLACNDAPTVAAGDEAIWDRLKLIPFDVKFRGAKNQIRDLGLLLLKEEASGILNWFIAGYQMWKEQGLNYPEEIRKATEEWREEEDYLARYLESHVATVDDQDTFVKKSALFTNFAAWAKDTKEGRNITDKQFSKQMRKKGYNDKLFKQYGKPNRCWEGIKLIDPLARFGAAAQREEEMLSSLDGLEFDAPRKPN